MTRVGYGHRIATLDAEIRAKSFNVDCKYQQAWEHQNKKLYRYQGRVGLNHVHNSVNNVNFSRFLKRKLNKDAKISKVY